MCRNSAAWARDIDSLTALTSGTQQVPVEVILRSSTTLDVRFRSFRVGLPRVRIIRRNRKKVGQGFAVFSAKLKRPFLAATGISRRNHVSLRTPRDACISQNTARPTAHRPELGGSAVAWCDLPNDEAGLRVTLGPEGFRGIFRETLTRSEETV